MDASDGTAVAANAWEGSGPVSKTAPLDFHRPSPDLKTLLPHDNDLRSYTPSPVFILSATRINKFAKKVGRSTSPRVPAAGGPTAPLTRLRVPSRRPRDHGRTPKPQENKPRTSPANTTDDTGRERISGFPPIRIAGRRGGTGREELGSRHPPPPDSRSLPRSHTALPADRGASSTDQRQHCSPKWLREDRPCGDHGGEVGVGR